MASVHPTVKNLIFDLGGVILDLAIDDTLRSFAGLAGVEMPVIHSWYNSAPEFITYEMGGCSDAEFRAFLNGYFPTPNLDEAIDQSWNMMLPVSKAKLDSFSRLKINTTFFCSATRMLSM